MKAAVNRWICLKRVALVKEGAKKEVDVEVKETTGQEEMKVNRYESGKIGMKVVGQGRFYPDLRQQQELPKNPLRVSVSRCCVRTLSLNPQL